MCIIKLLQGQGHIWGHMSILCSVIVGASKSFGQIDIVCKSTISVHLVCLNAECGFAINGEKRHS